MAKQDYIYPTVQTSIDGTVFIMSSTFDNGQYGSYTVKYTDSDGCHVVTFTHEYLKDLISRQCVTRQRRQTFANYKEFLKIPIKC